MNTQTLKNHQQGGNHERFFTSATGVPPFLTILSFLWNEFPCICKQNKSVSSFVRAFLLSVFIEGVIVLTADFEESQEVKKRVKKLGSPPSMITYIGASGDNFSRRESFSMNF